MQSIRINNNAGVCHIDIEGTIGVPEEWQFDQPEQRIATYEKFRDAVRRIGEIDAPEVVVNIRSTGGDVNDALLIHDALRQLSGRITTRCYGYTASAATIIAQAASDGCREISANALYLIHTSICATEGNAAELSGKIDLLRHTDRRLAEIYAARSGRTAEEFETLMAENNGNGRWLSPEETLAAGLADTIIDAGGTTTETSSAHPRNDARGWARLLAALGLHRGKGPSDELLDDRNVLHFDDEPESRQTSSIASDEAFRHAAPTTTRPCEDPSCNETIRTANQRAYAADARQFRK
ncbi:ATP-dependent Clp protease proteolytic subunit [uncultured Alistipes sp.]|jgi:ATP-dependent protease ClpP protease subunit|uniref:Clp protease ClpP n=1 Tax=uncultured Alistipes sp. TaxID=538949 RepID=UPI0025FA27D3|nr:Clp protease ClpP [uncultured Alistipes sp.]